MNEVIHTKLGEGRRVAIPAELCQRYGLSPGDPVVLEPSATGITLRPLDEVIREVQAYFAGIAPADVMLSEELLRDRRSEAARGRSVGMFDHVTCELPLPDGREARKDSFQTKSLWCCLSRFTITAAGRLIHHQRRWVPASDTVPRQLEHVADIDLDYHGDLE